MDKWIQTAISPRIPGSWKKYFLGDLGSFKNGLNFNKNAFGKGIKIINVKQLYQGRFASIDNLEELKRAEVTNLKEYSLKIGDIVFARSSVKLEGTGQVAMVGKLPNNETGFSGFIIRYRIDSELLDPTFVNYLLRSGQYREFFISIATGTSIFNLSQGILSAIPIYVPKASEQKTIASVLSSLDDKIDLLLRQNKTLEAMAKTLFRQWFVEEAQEDWRPVKVGDFVRTNITSINKDCSLKTIKYLDTSSLTVGKIEECQTLAIGDTPSRARRIVRHNDVLISTVRPNQKHYGILKQPAENLIVSTGFCVITCDKINPHFIYILLTTDIMTEYLHSIAEGSTSAYPSLKPSDIEEVEFQLPSEEKLIAYSEYADNAWNKIDYNHNQILILEELRDMLLPKLMSGEVRVKF